MSALNTVWSKEEGRTGQTIIVHRDKIEWANYEIPGTSYSSGSARYFSHQELFIGSALYGEIMAEFGELITNKILNVVQNSSNHEPFQKEQASINSITQYFSTIPEKQDLQSPWLTEHQPIQAVKKDFSSLRSIGVVSMETSSFNHDCFNLLTNDYLFKLIFTDSISFSTIKNPRGFILTTPRQIILGQRSDTGVKIINPLQHLPDLFSQGRKELDQLYLYDTYYLILFRHDRASKQAGELILQGDFNGNFIGKKTLSPLKFD